MNNKIQYIKDFYRNIDKPISIIEIKDQVFIKYTCSLFRSMSNNFIRQLSANNLNKKFLGLIFLTYVVFVHRHKLSYGKIFWRTLFNAIYNDIKFPDRILQSLNRNSPNPFLFEFVKKP